MKIFIKQLHKVHNKEPMWGNRSFPLKELYLNNLNFYKLEASVISQIHKDLNQRDTSP